MIDPIDRSFSDKGFDAESRLFFVLSKFGGFKHQETKNSSKRAGEDTDQESARRRQQVLPVQEAPRRVQNTGTRASVKRTLSRAVEVVREGTSQNVSFDTPFQTGERVLSVKMNFFIDREEIFL